MVDHHVRSRNRGRSVGTRSAVDDYPFTGRNPLMNIAQNLFDLQAPKTGNLEQTTFLLGVVSQNLDRSFPRQTNANLGPSPATFQVERGSILDHGTDICKAVFFQVELLLLDASTIPPRMARAQFRRTRRVQSQRPKNSHL